jgi:acyl-CoA synthetase (AMP-forming)/AMP-acid ligase II
VKRARWRGHSHCPAARQVASDITQQGFEKKKAKLLAPYLNQPEDDRSESPAPAYFRPPSNTGHYSVQEKTADSRAMAAAVQAALASRNSQEDNVPMSSRRATMPDTSLSPSSSFMDENGSVSSSSVASTPVKPPPQQQSTPTPPPTAPKTTRPRPNPPNNQGSLRMVKGGSSGAAMMTGPETVLSSAPGGKGGVSQKIQQLLNTLKRPKKNRRPIEEYYQDQDTLAPEEDPNAPKPVGPSMQPAVGVPLDSRHDWHRSLEAAVQHYSSTLAKSPAISVVDPHGKVSVAATYSKLTNRAQRVASYMLNKLGGGKMVQPCDRVALVFRPDEAAQFATAFYGCIFAAVIPVAVEPPVTKDDPGGQQVGFLLGSLGVTVALTSEATAKALPKEEGKDHIILFKGWPRLTWFVTEHLPKVSKDWSPPPRPQADTPTYIEYSTMKDGSALGVGVTRSALLTHCRSLSTACLYREGEVIVCTEDPKRSIGLWHAVMAAAYNGLHVVYVPPNVMTTLPTAWLHMIQKHKATCVVTSSRALNGCISLANHKELKDLNLEGVRMMLLDDGANPWSLASSDLFYDAYSPKGLSRQALCPCAGSPETLTVSLRRPVSTTTTGRGVMSISGLSYGVVRVEEQGSITSLTLQDVGLVMPGARVVAVKVSGLPILCKTDEIGEICVQTTASGSAYWGLQGKSTHTFRVQPLNEKEVAVTTGVYVRSGLLGFVGNGGLVFICGTLDGLIQVAGRRHNTEDIIATVMAVEPHSFVYRGRITVFSISVLRDERVVVVAEQRPTCTDEEAFSWMNNVVPAVESIHGLNLYGIVLVHPNKLPRGSNGVVHVQETKSRFIDGTLHPVNLLMCPHQCITNLPLPKPHTTVKGAAQLMGDMVTGRVAETKGQSLSIPFDERDGGGKFNYIIDVLAWRAQSCPENVLFSMVDSKGHTTRSINCITLHKRAERIAAFIVEKLNRVKAKIRGEHVAVIMPCGIDLVATFFGCLYAGFVPVTIRPPQPNNLPACLPTIKLTLEISNVLGVLTTHNVARILKSKEAAPLLDPKSVPPLIELDDVPKKKLESLYRVPSPEMIAYIDFNVSTTGVLSGVKVSHTAVMGMCRAHQHVSELYPSRELALCLDPYSGFGLVLFILSSIYSGHHSYLLNIYDLELNASLWLSVISTHKIRDTYCSYTAIEACCKELGSATNMLKNRGVDLSCVRSCVVVGEERPRLSLLSSFSALFSPLGLGSHTVSTSFGCRVNPIICLQVSPLQQ